MNSCENFNLADIYNHNGTVRPFGRSPWDEPSQKPPAATSSRVGGVDVPSDKQAPTIDFSKITSDLCFR